MRKLNIFLAILIAINITACDSKLEDLKKEKITKDINQSLENNESIIIPIRSWKAEPAPWGKGQGSQGKESRRKSCLPWEKQKEEGR